MATYRIEFAASAHRQFAKLAPDAKRRLAPEIDMLATEPRPHGAKRLATEDELYRIRVGVYRIVYAVENDLLVILVVKIGHRRDVYRGL
ncbi:MAG: type II toxin-antitoxin system RelE/ParE family toxin [Actinomycetota bacterium]|nr:type II toxin-antitoxin system RelE/ParE family toxin [Actinomycetota bacterium]